MMLAKGLGTAETIKKRFAVASERREMWRSTLADMYDFCIPNRETFNFHSPGQRKSRHLFDSTAPEALQTFVSVISSSMTPEHMKWMEYEAGSDIPEQDKKKVNGLLEDATKTFFKYMAHSDYSSQSNLSHQDMAISTGCLLVEEGDDITEPLLKFTAIPMSELYIEPTTMARAHTFFRKHKIKAQEVKLKFPGAEISEKLGKIITNSPQTDVEIIDGCQVFNFEDKQYYQVVIWENDVIFQQSYGEIPPGIIYRFSKIAGETYGRGPADMAMADIRTVNKVKEYLLKNAALTLSPPLMGVSDGIFNPHTARVAPGVVIPVGNMTSLAPLEVGGDLRIGQFVIEDLQNNIKKAFFADPLGEITDPVRSATENLIRQQEMLKKRGANFGRLNSEYVVPLVRRVTEILKANGKIPNMKVDGREVTLKMASPLAQMQKSENIDNLFVFLNGMQSLPEDVQLLGANLEIVPQFLQENLGLPENLAKTELEIKKAKKMIEQQAQLMQQTQGAGNAPT